MVKHWVREGRRYCLKKGVHWTIFSRYLVTKHAMHQDLHAALKNRMSDKLLQAETAWTLSTFIEKILLEQLPQEVRYDISQDQMIANHVERLIWEHADIRYLCQHLDDNALSLTWTHPYYVESKEVNGVFVGPKEQMKVTNMIKKSMLVTIVTLAGFRQRLNQNYNHRTKRTELEKVT